MANDSGWTSQADEWTRFVGSTRLSVERMECGEWSFTIYAWENGEEVIDERWVPIAEALNLPLDSATALAAMRSADWALELIAS